MIDEAFAALEKSTGYTGRVPMTNADDCPAHRPCLLPPLPEHDAAAKLLAAAADAIITGQVGLADRYMREADMRLLRDFANKLLGTVDPMILRRRPGSSESRLAPPKARMPAARITRQVHERDGWWCRFCGCKVVAKQARDAFRAYLPDALPWAKSEGYHAAFLALTATLDHLIPHSSGGDNAPDNLVTTCWPCQFGKAHYSLDELTLDDPRKRPPFVDSWDGLWRILKHKRRL